MSNGVLMLPSLRSDRDNKKIGKSYTDAPAMVVMHPSGRVETSEICNVLMAWSAAEQELDPGAAPGDLGIRWARNGHRYFESEGERFAVDDTSYLLLNPERSYQSHISSETEVDCFTVCLRPPFTSEVLRANSKPDAYLLDEPIGENSAANMFMEQSYYHNDTVSPILARLEKYRDIAPNDYAWFDEQFHALMDALLVQHREVYREIDSMPAVRAATREELYRRLHRAKELIECRLYEPLSLAEIATYAALSPHHFLRLFKQVFKETPHHYQIRRRLERARHLLINTNQSITNICLSVGFESMGSFSWMFRKHHGVSPQMFRREAGLKAEDVSA